MKVRHMVIVVLAILAICAGTAFGQYTDSSGGSWNKPTSAAIGDITTASSRGC